MSVPLPGLAKVLYRRPISTRLSRSIGTLRVGVSGLHPPTLVAGLHDLTMMGHPVQQRSRHLAVTEYLRPFPLDFSFR